MHKIYFILVILSTYIFTHYHKITLFINNKKNDREIEFSINNKS